MKAISLMYHDVANESDASGFLGADAALYKITASDFARQISLITGMTAKKPILATAWTGERQPIFITFDDGGASAITAAEILERHGWRGHFFITTGRIGTTGFVSKNDIIELHQRGHIVGSHSDSHPLRLASLSKENIFSEWRVSTEKLMDILGEKIVVASVPGGLYSIEVAECAEANGIRFLFNSEPTTKVHQIGNCWIFGRYTVQNWMKADEISAIAAGKPLPRLKQYLLWNAKKPLKRIGGEGFLKLRSFMINKFR